MERRVEREVVQSMVLKKGEKAEGKDGWESGDDDDHNRVEYTRTSRPIKPNEGSNGKQKNGLLFEELLKMKWLELIEELQRMNAIWMMEIRAPIAHQATTTHMKPIEQDA